MFCHNEKKRFDKEKTNKNMLSFVINVKFIKRNIIIDYIYI